MTGPSLLSWEPGKDATSARGESLVGVGLNPMSRIRRIRGEKRATQLVGTGLATRCAGAVSPGKPPIRAVDCHMHRHSEGVR